MQPAYGVSVSGASLVNPESASVGHVARALNGFYGTFLERCIKENEEFAKMAETDCYRENCQNNDKVLG